MSDTTCPHQDITEQADMMLVADSLFGDSRAIEERNIQRFRLGLLLIAKADQPHAEGLCRVAELRRDELQSLMRDPVVRNAFEDDLVKLENGVGDSCGLGGLLASISAQPAALGPCERMAAPHVRPWPLYGAAWLWTDIRPVNAVSADLAARLRRLYDGSIEGGPATEPVFPEPDMRRRLTQGSELLTRLLPLVGPSVLRHVSLVGFTRADSSDGPLQSLSGGDPLPSAILMAPERLSDPWTVAETLLHESVHLKLFDALRACSLLTDADHQVPIPWRQTPWRLVRVLVALHFYCHLLVFEKAVHEAGPELREAYGEPPVRQVIDEVSVGTEAARDGTYGSSVERARHLAGYIQALKPGALTVEGRRLAEWLIDVLGLVTGGGTSDRLIAQALVEPAGSSQPDLPVSTAVHRRDAVQVRPLPDQGQLLVSNTDTATMYWLNARSWLVYSLCDGRDIGLVSAAYGTRCGTGVAESHRQVSDCLRDLANCGLVGMSQT